MPRSKWGLVRVLKTIGVTEFKRRLRKHLLAANRGDQYVITKRGVPIAFLDAHSFYGPRPGGDRIPTVEVLREEAEQKRKRGGFEHRLSPADLEELREGSPEE